MLKIDPKHALAWNYKGFALDKLERYEDAIRWWDEALKIDPKNTFAWIYKGFALDKLERYEDAIRCYDEALKINPEDADAKKNKKIAEGKFEQQSKLKEQAVEAINATQQAIKRAENLGIAISDSKNLHNEAKSAFEDGDYLAAIRKSKDAEEETNKLLTKAKPEIRVSLSETSFKQDLWQRIDLTVRNDGNVTAREITINFSKEVETRGLSKINLNPGEEKRLNIGFRATQSGEIPLEVLVTYKDSDNKEYRTNDTFWITSTDEEAVSSKEELKSPAQFQPWPTSPKTFPPELAEAYTEVKYIGEGGFARVFKAKNKDGKKVAVKVPLSLDEATGKSFIKEIQNWTRFDHPNIVKVQDYNIMPVPFFELELCDGSLDEMKRPLEPEKAAWLIFNICEGLKYAHSQGVIHRDLKPQNILLKDGIPKISDWGLSKVVAESPSRRGLGSFTPIYAAPEQISGGRKDERTDIWQVGVILYELVTGEIPFKGESMVEMGMAIVTSQPVPPSSLNPEAESLEPVITRCLEKDQAERYESAGELQKELAQYLGIKYQESLKLSKSRGDSRKSAYYCSELLMMNMGIKDLVGAYKFASDMAHYAEGEAKPLVEEFCGQLEARINAGIKEPPEELVKKAEVICHKIRVGFKK